MRRLTRNSSILTVGVLLLGGWGNLAPARAGMITPDSIGSPPAPVSPIAQGRVVLPSQQAFLRTWLKLAPTGLFIEADT